MDLLLDKSIINGKIKAIIYSANILKSMDAKLGV
jgi:hypothetical protein